MRTVTIQGLQFNLSDPYTEGHPLTAAEANALNQLRAENIGNNMRKAIKEAAEAHSEVIPDGVLQDFAAKVAEYDAAYEFSMSSGSGGAPRILDPVEKRALEIARAKVRDQARTQKRKILAKGVEATSDTDITRERFEEVVRGLAKREDIVKLAKKQVKDQEATAAGEVDL